MNAPRSAANAEEQDPRTSARAAAPAPPPAGSTPMRAHRWELTGYPDARHRPGYLLLTALATVALYYCSFASAAVSASVLTHYRMSFPFYVNITVLGFLLGAGTALVAGLADRWGRVRFIAGGLAVVGVLVAFVQPHMPDKVSYAAVAIVVGLVEGMVLVATPALMRDFSPQLSRATAMSLWTLGPVLGSLVASAVSSATLPHLPAWQDQFTIAGVTALVVSVVTTALLRDVPAALRHQRLVRAPDAVAAERHAADVHLRSDLARPWRQMLTGRTLASSFAISVFLLFYYAVIGFLVLYLVLNFGYTEPAANAVANWFWAAMAIALVAVGIASDRLGVRKPFMVAGAIGAAACTAVFAVLATAPGTSFATLAVVMALIAVFLGVAYVPWMAAYTETVEAVNPALSATGLAVFGGVLRVVSAAFLFAVPYLVTSVTPLSEHGAHISELTARYSQQVQTAQAISPDTLQALIADQSDQAAIGQAVAQVSSALHIGRFTAVVRLQQLAAVPAADLRYLYSYGPDVLQARDAGPAQWQRMWWVTVGGQLLFIPLVFTLIGPWRRPAR